MKKFNHRLYLITSFAVLIVAGFINTASNAQLRLGAGPGAGSGVKPVADSTAIKTINAAGFKRHLAVLASDSLGGRKPFTKGETLTLDYLTRQCKDLALKPGNRGTYLQDVPMVEINSTAFDGLQIQGAKGTVRLSFKTDFVAITRRVQAAISVQNSDVVFAGYGIVAPEYHWNDYAGLNVRGKTVLVLVNDPGYNDPTLFRGKNMTYYGRWTYKYEEAARQGAAALLIIHDTGPASYPWSVVRSSNTGAKLHLQTPDNDLHRAAVEGWITQESTHKIFQLAGVSEDEITKAGKPGFKGVDLRLTASVSLKNTIKRSTSHNVIAVLPGKTRPGEYIIYSAHWDHFGTGESVKGDSIYNGAIDNATGCAALLEIAGAFKAQKQAPGRSVVFLFVTAEEQGLLGSEYYASNPVYPVKKTVANLNIDALLADGPMKDISIVGYGQSELEDYAGRSASKQGRIIRKDPNPSRGSFFRSDHFNFAKVGVPALDPETGDISMEHGEAWGKAAKEDYTKNRYHQPSDNFEPAKWDLRGIVNDTRLLYDVGYTLSRESTYPKWKPGSEFKAIREKSLSSLTD